MTTIERLRAWLAEATPGPWFWDRVMGGIRVRDHYVLASLALHRFPNADEVLVVGAVNALPALLAVAEAAGNLISETYFPHHTPSIQDSPEEWDVQLEAPSSGTCERLIAALAALDAPEEATP